MDIQEKRGGKISISARFIRIIILYSLIVFTILTFFRRVYSGLSREYEEIVINYQNLNEYYDLLYISQQYLNNYVLTLDPAYREEYEKQFDRMNECIEVVKENFWRNYQQNSYGKLIDLERMTQSYHEEAKQAFVAAEEKERSKAYFYAEEAKAVNEIIMSGMNQYYLKLNEQTFLKYTGIVSDKQKWDICFWIIGAATLIISIRVLWISIKNIVIPLNKLTKQAVEIGNGHFEVPIYDSSSVCEINQLSIAFKKMLESIHYYVDQVKYNAELEKKLVVEENKNLRNIALLKETKLQILESQINPHFLFNTLNMLGNLAFMEGAGETREALDITGELLRFYLDKSEKCITLREEIEHVSDYIYIQHLRLGNRIKFDMELGPAITNVKIPGLLIQPLIENAIQHGLHGVEDQETVSVKFYENDEYVVIEVSDNGIGCPYTEISQIKDRKNKKSIGLKNISERLAILYDRLDLLKIFPRQGGGTIVQIRVPKGACDEKKDYGC